VNGAFLGGEPQVDRVGDRTRLELRNVGTLVLGPHTLRLGGGVRRDALSVADASGFGGVFEFASLADFSRESPFVYRVIQGTPRLSLISWETEAFAQDEIKLGNPLRLMIGARYDRSSEIHDGDNVAPRLALAYSPGSQKTVFRAGFGVFYERLPSWVSERRLLEDGLRVRDVVIPHPSYPDPFISGEGSLVPPSVFRTAPQLETPYVVQASAAWERRLGRWTVLTVEYAFLRGFHLFRERDVNAPLPGSGLRPDPSLRNVLEIGSSGRMRSHALTFTYHGQVGPHFKATAQYTLAHTRNDVPGAGAESGAGHLELPADNYNLEKEYGRADFDRRHRVSVAGLLDLPLRLQIGVLLKFRSSAPFDITTGRDDNGDTYANDRPPGVPRNAGDGPPFTQLDLRLTKEIRTASPFPGEKQRQGRIQVILDAFNVLNQVNYGQYVGVMTSPFFGRAVLAKNPRTFQFAMRYGF
jgi:outer membrane receptor protein involved in Fe transport